MIYTNQILMKQGKIIQQKQEFNTAIQRFGMYLFIKIKKIFKKISANPKIQRLKCGCALICQFSQFLHFFLQLFLFSLSTQFKKNKISFLFFYSRPKSRRIEDDEQEHNFSLMYSTK